MASKTKKSKNNNTKKSKPAATTVVKDNSIDNNTVADNTVSNTVVDVVNIEDELTKYGYHVIKTILVKKESCQKTLIKANNKLGQYVYIIIDDISVVSTTHHVTMNDTTTTIIPYSVISASMTLAGMDVCGIIFECQESGLCLLENVLSDDNLTVVESNYLIDQNTKPDHCYINYPIVKLSEIRVNNDLVLEGTTIVTNRLRTDTYDAYYQNLINVQHAITHFNGSYQRLFDLFKIEAIKLKDTLKMLESWHMHYINHPPQNDIDIQKSNSILKQILIRNEYVERLLCTMMRISEYESQMNQLTEQVNEYHDTFNKLFTKLDFV
ncbi:MAG TPA: hypothetical protein VLG50_08395 [Candidatus Saccharimonadales bacterium]|nr:hypothetical protein [Candidatus Saccharimonadales bacterium]